MLDKQGRTGSVSPPVPGFTLCAHRKEFQDQETGLGWRQLTTLNNQICSTFLPLGTCQILSRKEGRALISPSATQTPAQRRQKGASRALPNKFILRREGDRRCDIWEKKEKKKVPPGDFHCCQMIAPRWLNVASRGCHVQVPIRKNKIRMKPLLNRKACCMYLSESESSGTN